MSAKPCNTYDSTHGMVDKVELLLSLINSCNKKSEFDISDKLLQYSCNEEYFAAFLSNDIILLWKQEIELLTHPQTHDNDDRQDMLILFANIHNNLLLFESHTNIISSRDEWISLYLSSMSISSDTALLSSCMTGITRIIKHHITTNIIDNASIIAAHVSIILSNSLDSGLLQETFRLLSSIVDHISYQDNDDDDDDDDVNASSLYEQLSKHHLHITSACVVFLYDKDSMNALRLSSTGLKLLLYVLQVSYQYVVKKYNMISSFTSPSSSSSNEVHIHDESIHNPLTSCILYINYLFNVALQGLSSYSYDEKQSLLDAYETLSSHYFHITADDHHDVYDITPTFIAEFHHILTIMKPGMIIMELYEMMIEAMIRRHHHDIESIAYVLLMLYIIYDINDASDKVSINFYDGIMSLLDTITDPNIYQWMSKSAGKITHTLRFFRLLDAHMSSHTIAKEIRSKIHQLAIIT